MSRIHSSCALVGLRSSLRCGTARLSTVRSIAYRTHGSAITASPIHSRRVAFDWAEGLSGIRQIKRPRLERATKPLAPQARLVPQPVLDGDAHRRHIFRHRIQLAGELQRLARAHTDPTERRAAYEPRLDLGRVDVARCVGEADADARTQPGNPATGVERDAAAACKI